MKLLIADDSVNIRMLLYATAEYSGFEPLLAENGAEAIELFDQHPDVALVLTDVYMPLVDGLSVARHVRQQQRPVHVPIVFMTGVNADDIVAEFLEIGDDIISKPFSQTVILAKLAAHRRLVQIHRTLAQQNQALLRFRQVTEAEHFVASDVIQRSMQGGLTDMPGVVYHTQPVSAFNGDSVLLARHRSGSCYFMVADVSGHGLPAAMGTLPLIEAFLGMVQQTQDVGSLARHMNLHFRQKMPDYLLAAVLLGEIETNGEVVRLWNGGMPPVMLLDKNGRLKQVIPSRHMPLGAITAGFSQECSEHILCDGEQLLCFSDGVIEAMNDTGSMFGQERLQQMLRGNASDQNVVSRVAACVEAFRNGAPPNDDLTLLFYRCQGSLPGAGSDCANLFFHP